MRWLRQWWPALVWALLISTLSTGAFTSENTSRIIVPILHWLLPHTPMSTLLQIHFVIRKCMHFAEYFIFSLLVLRGIRAGRKENHLAWALFAIALVFAYASLDEWHQRFVPGRTSSFRDVLIDTSGGTAAQLIAALLVLWRHVRERQREIALEARKIGSGSREGFRER
jgi:VanZ family protein